MGINLYGPWRMIQAMLPLLRASGHPRIVNISSGAGSHGDQRYGLAARRGAAASYGISKAALLALTTTTVAAELDATPVIINAVDPGLTATWPGAEAMDARPVADSVPGIVWAATLPRRRPPRRLLPRQATPPLVTRDTEHPAPGVIPHPTAATRPQPTRTHGPAAPRVWPAGLRIMATT